MSAPRMIYCVLHGWRCETADGDCPVCTKRDGRHRAMYREMFADLRLSGNVDPFVNRDPRRLGRYG